MVSIWCQNGVLMAYFGHAHWRKGDKFPWESDFWLISVPLPKWRYRNQNGGSHENFAGGKFYIVHLKKKIQVNKKQKKTNKFTDFFKIKHSSISQSCIASFISLSLLNSLFSRSLAAKRDVLKRTPRTLMIPINQRSPRAQVDPKTKRYSVLHKDQNPRHISQLWNRM